jgi:hypothetical protein
MVRRLPLPRSSEGEAGRLRCRPATSGVGRGSLGEPGDSRDGPVAAIQRVQPRRRRTAVPSRCWIVRSALSRSQHLFDGRLSPRGRRRCALECSRSRRAYKRR